MPLSVAQFAQVSDWFSTGTSKSATGLSWSSGDIIVVIGGGENEFTTLGTPSNANLSFTLQTSQTGGTQESNAYLWTATAGSSQSSQTISVTRSGDNVHWGFAVWVITGSPSGVANATSNRTESSISRTVGSGSVVIHGLIDWNATNPPGKTYLAGSGTATERRDAGNGSNFAQWMADWVGTSSGTFSFGPNNYTSLKVSQVIIEVLAPAGGSTVTFTGSGAWGALTGSLTAKVKHPVTVSQSWGGLTGSMTAGVKRSFTASGAWGGLTGSGTFAPKKSFTASGAFGALTGTLSATVKHPATFSGAWGALTGSTTALVKHVVTGSGAWGSLTGSLSATVRRSFTGSGAWGGLTGAISATVKHPVTVSQSWGALTGTATFTPTTPGAAELQEHFEGGADGVALSTSNTNFDNLSGAGTSVFDDDAPAPLRGTMSALFTAGAAQNRIAAWTTSWQTETEVFLRIYVYKTGNPTNNTAIMELASGATAGADVRITTTGTVQFRDATKTARATSTALADNTLHRIEWRILHSDTVGRIEGRIFSGANAHGTTPDQTLGSSTTDRDTNPSSDTVRFGVLEAPGGAGWSLYIDSAGVSNTDWLGPVVSNVSFSGSGAWGALTGSMTAGVKRAATMTGAWGALTSSSTFGVRKVVTATGAWGALVATMTSTVKRSAVLTGSWGGLTGTATFTIGGAAPPELVQLQATGAWGAMVGSMSAFTKRQATMSSNWGGLMGHMWGPGPRIRERTPLSVGTMPLREPKQNRSRLRRVTT